MHSLHCSGVIFLKKKKPYCVVLLCLNSTPICSLLPFIINVKEAEVVLKNSTNNKAQASTNQQIRPCQCGSVNQPFREGSSSFGPKPTPPPPSPHLLWLLSAAFCSPNTPCSSMTLYFAHALPSNRNVFNSFVVNFLPPLLLPIWISIFDISWIISTFQALFQTLYIM